MPLKKGYSQQTFAYNLRELLRAGHDRASSLAAAYRAARLSFIKAHPNLLLPAWLKFGKPAARRIIRKRNPSPHALTLTQKIKKWGGINVSEIRDITGERKAGKGIAGIPPGLFTRNGRGLDDLATSLYDAGYPIDIGDVDGGVAYLRDQVRNEIDGVEKYYPGDQFQQFEEQYADYYGTLPTQKTKRAAKKKSAAKKKPATKRRPSFDIVDRPSRITGLPPSRRLVSRRMRNNEPGYFPNPVPASKKVQIRNASKLYSDFTGHEATEYELVDKPVIPDVMLLVGDVDGILYTTVRDGKTEKYIHKFKAASRPLFTVSHDGKQLYMLGGSYDFTELGIVDKT